MGLKSLRFFNAVISFVVTVTLLAAALYAGFALWDNHQIYQRADSVFDEMKAIKNRMAQEAAEREAAEKAAAREAELQAQAEQEALLAAATAVPIPESSYDTPFDALRAINTDVNGWVTMPGTAIDFPLVQGETNFTYINTDVYGNFALSGSIFLDSRNDPNYTDVYSLLYGHNMSRHRMFGDVNLYKDETFFAENQEGQLFLPDRAHTLQSLTCIVTRSSDSAIFNPNNWKDREPEEILAMVTGNAVCTSEAGLQALRDKLDAGEQPRILALSTCSEEFTDARTILLTLLDP